jgi:hypothetical protein
VIRAKYFSAFERGEGIFFYHYSNRSSFLITPAFAPNQISVLASQDPSFYNRIAGVFIRVHASAQFSSRLF